MPTILLINGLRFFFYSNEGNEPMHIHVTKAEANGKIWMEPGIEIAYLHGFSKSEEREILHIVSINYKLIKTKWNEYFSK
ncbi:MAG TPA: DUF4160 domain-containing protein [Chitinophagaceae bacterium]|nr:DUF4160 domain-containing protein [Chitinophagaceae bacterium]